VKAESSSRPTPTATPAAHHHHPHHHHHHHHQVNADQITSGHGWRGALNFAQAARTLTAVDIDHREKEIYMAVEPGYPETLLLVSEAGRR
jgi:hypothetical protein